MNNGFSIATAVFSGEECNELLRALTSACGDRSRAGVRHLMRDPTIAAFAGDERLTSIAAAHLGTAAVPFRATLFDKSAQRNWLIAWHQDTALPLASRFDLPGWGRWSSKFGVDYAHAPGWALARVIAVRVHLDASTSDNGPLRVIPGSHVAGVLSDQAGASRVKSHAENIIECTTPRGGVVAMRPLIIHASSKAQNPEPRRVLHIEYADTLDLAPGICLSIV